MPLEQAKHLPKTPKTVLVLDALKEDKELGYVSHLVWADSPIVLTWFIIHRPKPEGGWRVINIRCHKGRRQAEGAGYNGPAASEKEMMDGFTEMLNKMISEDQSISQYKLYPVQSDKIPEIKAALEKIAMERNDVDFVFAGKEPS